MLGALALILDVAVPVKTKHLEGSQDLIGRSPAHARAIEILHAYQPAPAVAARVGITAERGDQ